MLNTLSAPGSTTALIGVFGFGGAAAFGTVYLALGLWGNGKIHFTHRSAVISGFVIGQLWSQAGEMWSFTAGLSGGLNEALAQSFGQGAQYGPAATAGILVLLMYGLDLKGPLAVPLGLISPPAFTAAGGGFAIITTTISSALESVFG